MKFLHLADLHIGKSVNEFSMLEEQRHVFRQIMDYVQSRQPDAVVIAGDVYDRAVPGVEAVRAFDDFLTELAAANVAVIVIAGNHDSPERLNYASRLLQDKKLYLCGLCDGRLSSVTLTDEYGPVTFWLLPFIKPAMLRNREGDDTGATVMTGATANQDRGESNRSESARIESYAEAVAFALARAVVDETARNVLVSHQFYTAAGTVPVRSESESNAVGGLDAVDTAPLGRFDYVALGHLHGPQTVGGKHIRYAGSPLKYSFSEWRQEKSITLVELRKKGDLAITTLPLAPLHDMREIKGPLEELLRPEIIAQGDKEDYLKVVLTDEGVVIDPMARLRAVYPNIMLLGYDNAAANIDPAAIGTTVAVLRGLSPDDLFHKFFFELTQTDMSAAQEKLLEEFFADTSNDAEGSHETA